MLFSLVVKQINIMSAHITFIIARQLLEEKRSEVLSRVKPRPKEMTQTHHARINKEVLQEVKAINDELWLLNNW